MLNGCAMSSSSLGAAVGSGRSDGQADPRRAASAHPFRELKLPDEPEGGFSGRGRVIRGAEDARIIAHHYVALGTYVCAQLDQVVGLGTQHRSNERHVVIPIRDAAREKPPVAAKANDVAGL